MSPIPATTATFPNTRATHAHGHGLVHVGLSWIPTDAAAVKMHIAQHGYQTSRWVFARDLLADGVNYPVGDGDITITPALRDDWTELVIRDPNGIGGNLALHLHTDGLRRFVDRTHTRVPAGAEVYDFDTARLFAPRGEAA